MRARARLLPLVLLAAGAAHAGDGRALLEDKLAKPFVKNAAWVLDYGDALARAKEHDRIVFAYFTRSYAP